MAHSSRLIFALLVSTLAACGGKSFDSDPHPNGGGTGQGGSGQGGSAAGSSRGGTSGKAGGTSTSGSGQGGSAGAECAGFEDATGSYLQVLIINKTSAAIYLGQDMVTCGVSPLFQVDDAGGALPPPSTCSASCQVLMEAGPIGCPAICAFPSAIALQPGEILYTSWDGLYQVQRELPQQCVPRDYGAGTCQQTKLIQPGAFTFSAVAGRSIDCKATTGATCNTCTPTPDAAGGCRTPGALIAGQMLKAVTNVQLDARFGVYGNPAPAPAPLPLPNPGGGSSDPIPPTVELIFTE